MDGGLKQSVAHSPSVLSWAAAALEILNRQSFRLSTSSILNGLKERTSTSVSLSSGKRERALTSSFKNAKRIEEDTRRGSDLLIFIRNWAWSENSQDLNAVFECNELRFSSIFFCQKMLLSPEGQI